MSSRRRLIYVLAAMLPILLVGGIWLGGHPEDLPSFARSGLEAHAETRVVDEALERISSDYYRPVSTASLANASVAGAVGSLHDRFSHYLSPKEFREFDAPPSFTGHRRGGAAGKARAADRARVRLLARGARGTAGGRIDRRRERSLDRGTVRGSSRAR